MLVIVSCHRNDSRLIRSSKWTEAQKQNYFVDSFAYIEGSGSDYRIIGNDSAKSFGSFLRRQYPDLHTPYYMDPLPHALEEEYIDTTRIDSSRDWVRFIVYSFFDLPYNLVLERKAGRLILRLKWRTGEGYIVLTP